MRIARLAAIPIHIHWSFLAVAAVYGAYALATTGFFGLIDTAILTAALFGSVTLHELGHALMARQFGIRTRDITLYPFGGIAALEGLPRRPLHELLVAIAGPAVNAGLFVVAFAVWMASGVDAALVFAAINLGMGLFNMLPAFPMDGGRVLRAALAVPFGHDRASHVAIGVGRVFALLFVGLGVLTWRPGLLMVGIFLNFAVARERASFARASAWRPAAVRWRVARSSA